MIYFLLVLLSIWTIVLAYTTYINYNKYIKMEQLFNETMINNDQLVLVLNEIQENVKKTLKTIRDIDLKGAFESDDEVGAVFSGIKEMLLMLEPYTLEPLYDRTSTGQEET